MHVHMDDGTQLPRSRDDAFVVLRLHTLMGTGQEARLRCLRHIWDRYGGLLMDHVWMLFLCGPSFTNCWMEISGRCICKKPGKRGWSVEKSADLTFGTILGINHRLERALHVEQKLEI
ncbi:hypothetical protein BSKO_09739 [Bryopsis sp. KO-2023]|nr:hypothetical protein BSKO_09739 [Bryopsis sp. KO-2023]